MHVFLSNGSLRIYLFGDRYNLYHAKMLGTLPPDCLQAKNVEDHLEMLRSLIVRENHQAFCAYSSTLDLMNSA